MYAQTTQASQTSRLTPLKAMDKQRMEERKTTNILTQKEMSEFRKLEQKGRTIQLYRKMNDFANLKYDQNGKDYRKYKDTTFFRRLCEEIGIKSSVLEDVRSVVNKYNEAEQRGDRLYLACLDKAISENSYSVVAKLAYALKKVSDDTMQDYLDGKVFANAIIESTRSGKSAKPIKQERSIKEICREMKDPDYTYTSTPDDAVMVFESYANEFLFCINSMTDDEFDYKQAIEKLSPEQKIRIRNCLNNIHKAEQTINKYL